MFHKFCFLFLIICGNPFTAFGISDLHIAIESSLSIPFRKIIKDYARMKSMIITADFRDSSSLFTDLEKGPHLVVSLRDTKRDPHLIGVEFASDKLYLCLAKSSPLMQLLSKNDNLNTALKIAKKHSAFIVPDRNSAVGNIINNIVLKLDMGEVVEVKNFENLGYTAVKSGAFVILPGSAAVQHESAGIEKLFEIPQKLYPEIWYNITVLENEGINQSREFVKFLFLGEVQFRELGFHKGV